jgi:hypothetical protein
VRELKSAGTQAREGVKLLWGNLRWCISNEALANLKQASPKAAYSGNVGFELAMGTLSGHLGIELLRTKLSEGVLTQEDVTRRMRTIFRRDASTWKAREIRELVAIDELSRSYNGTTSPIRPEGFSRIVRDMAARYGDSYENGVQHANEYRLQWLNANQAVLTPAKVERRALKLLGMPTPTSSQARELHTLLFDTPAGQQLPGPRNMLSYTLRSLADDPADRTHLRRLAGIARVWSDMRVPHRRAEMVESIKRTALVGHAESFAEKQMVEHAPWELKAEALQSIPGDERLAATVNVLRHSRGVESAGHLLEELHGLLVGDVYKKARGLVEEQIPRTGVQVDFDDAAAFERIRWEVLNAAQRSATRPTNVRTAEAVLRKPVGKITPAEIDTLLDVFVGAPDTRSAAPTLAWMHGLPRLLLRFDPEDRELKRQFTSLQRIWSVVHNPDLAGSKERTTASVKRLFSLDSPTKKDLQILHDLLWHVPEVKAAEGPTHFTGITTAGLAVQYELAGRKNNEAFDIYAAAWRGHDVIAEARAAYAADVGRYLDGEIPTVPKPPDLLWDGEFDAALNTALASAPTARRLKWTIQSIDVAGWNSAPGAARRQLRQLLSAVKGAPIDQTIRTEVLRVIGNNLRRIEGHGNSGYLNYPDFSDFGRIKSLLELAMMQKAPPVAAPSPNIVVW